MKIFARIFSICILALVALVPASKAQGVLVTTGAIRFSLAGSFINNLSSQGVSISYTGFNYSNSSFTAIGGSLTTRTGAGTVQSLGTMTFSSSAHAMTFSNFYFDTTTTTPYLTAIVTIDGITYGRYPVYEIVNGNPYPLPLQSGTTVVTPVNAYFRPNPAYKDIFLSYFNVNIADYSAFIGAATITATLL